MDIQTSTNTLTFSPIRQTDYGEVVDVINASDRTYVGHDILTVDEFANDLRTFDANLETDTCVVRQQDGKVIAYADYWAGVTPHVRMYGFLRIHPEHKGQGAGSALTQWMEARAREEMLKAPAGLKITLGQRAYAVQANARKFLETCGYDHARSSYRMTILLSDEIPEPVLPKNITLMTLEGGEDQLRRAIKAEQEAFLDHYGVIEEPFEDYYKREKTHILGDDSYDLSACYMALDGEEVAAVCINQTSRAGNEKGGWVGTLGVRRPWRKQGLGLALLRTTFQEMKKRGKESVGLYVDSENLTGALRLYQKAGMVVEFENCYFEKVLRPGRDLANHGD